MTAVHNGWSSLLAYTVAVGPLPLYPSLVLHVTSLSAVDSLANRMWVRKTYRNKRVRHASFGTRVRISSRPKDLAQISHIFPRRD